MRFTCLLYRINRRSLAAAAALLAAVLLTGVPFDRTVVHAQRPFQIFISAVDGAGTPVTDLKAEEVNVEVDGAACKTTKFEQIDWPMKLTVLVDNGPVYTATLNQLRTSLRAFFEELPRDIEISLISLAPAPRFIVKPGTDRDLLLKNIDLIIPDSGSPKFIDGIAEAADRINKDKANHFPVIMALGTNGLEGSQARDYQVQKLFKQIYERAATVHVVMLNSSRRQSDIASGTNGVELGIKLTELTGGRYEAIAATTRLETLLPEFSRQIAKSNARQTHQYRVTCQPPGNAQPQRVSATTTRANLSAALSFDGHIP